MTTVEATALERVLSSIDVRLGDATRLTLAADGAVALERGAVWLVFVAAGTVQGHPPFDRACALDVDRDTKAVDVSPEHPRDSLIAGDAFLSLGRSTVDLTTEHGASVMIAELQLSDTAVQLRDLLPEFITVTDFAGLEPSAAALAGTLGRDSEACALRSGDPLICRMMTTTVLLSVIRAWAENGCAPQGWPAPSDPFLDRVVAAIHDEPGRDWTVEALANVGAMSRSVFAERFRQRIGRSPASYVTEVRMDAAKKLLDAGHSVSMTSRDLGYASDEGFSRAFRRHTGLAPSAWRANRGAVLPAGRS